MHESDAGTAFLAACPVCLNRCLKAALAATGRLASGWIWIRMDLQCPPYLLPEKRAFRMASASQKQSYGRPSGAERSEGAERREGAEWSE